MGFTLILRGGGAAVVAEVAPELVEELAGRGTAARVLSDGPPGEGVRVAAPGELADQARALRAAGAAAVVLWTREGGPGPLAAAPEAVTIDWPAPGAPAAALPDAHGAVAPGSDARQGLASVFAILEGLGYLAFQGTALSPADDAELTERLKELGYL